MYIQICRRIERTLILTGFSQRFVNINTFLFRLVTLLICMLFRMKWEKREKQQNHSVHCSFELINFYLFYETSPISLLSISCICSYQCLHQCFHLATGTSYQIDFQSVTELIFDDSIATNHSTYRIYKIIMILCLFCV